MPTRSGCSLSTDIDIRVDSTMAGKHEGDRKGPQVYTEKEPTLMDLYNLLLDTKKELKKDFKESAEGIRKEIDGVKKMVKAAETKIKLNKSSFEQKLAEAQSKFTP